MIYQQAQRYRKGEIDREREKQEDVAKILEAVATTATNWTEKEIPGIGLRASLTTQRDVGNRILYKFTIENDQKPRQVEVIAFSLLDQAGATICRLGNPVTEFSPVRGKSDEVVGFKVEGFLKDSEFAAGGYKNAANWFPSGESTD